MDIESFQLDLSFRLVPIWQDVPPTVKLSIDHEIFWNDKLPDVREFALERQLRTGPHSLQIELYGKSDNDSCQALSIRDISFGKIPSSRYAWQSTYCPRYPQPWASQQQQQGVELKSELYQTDHLGWNGVWKLHFSMPIFTWIHQVENLGWVYD